MNYDDGLQGNEDRRRSDEDGRHAGKGANLFWNIQACVDFCLLQTILREFSFFTMLAVLAFQ